MLCPSEKNWLERVLIMSREVLTIEYEDSGNVKLEDLTPREVELLWWRSMDVPVPCCIPVWQTGI